MATGCDPRGEDDAMVVGAWWWKPVGFSEDACKIRKQGLKEVFVR